MQTGYIEKIARANLLGSGDENNTDPIAIVSEDDGGQSWIPVGDSLVQEGSRVGIAKNVTYLGKGSKTTYRLIPL